MVAGCACACMHRGACAWPCCPWPINHLQFSLGKSVRCVAYACMRCAGSGSGAAEAAEPPESVEVEEI